MKYSKYEELENVVHLQLPRAIIENPKYKDLSSLAKFLYMLMYDKMKVSFKNDWKDDQGYVFIYYKIEAIKKDLGVGDRVAIKLKKELKEFGLIEEVKRGFNMPNAIYVKKAEGIKPTQYFQNESSSTCKMKAMDLSKCNPNNNKRNNNKRIIVCSSSKKENLGLDFE